MQNELITREELAKRIRVSKRAILRLEKEGLPSIVIGHRSPRYDFDAVVAWLKKRSNK